MEHGGQSDPGAKMAGVRGDGNKRLRRRLEQQVINDGLVLPGDVGDRRRQTEHDVEVSNGQQLRFPLGQPFFGGHRLALRAVTIAPGVVGDPHMGAVLAPLDMAAESCGAAALDGRHDLQLSEAHMSGVGVAPGWAMAAEDIRQLNRWTRQGRAAIRRAAESAREGVLPR